MSFHSQFLKNMLVFIFQKSSVVITTVILTSSGQFKLCVGTEFAKSVVCQLVQIVLWRKSSVAEHGLYGLSAKRFKRKAILQEGFFLTSFSSVTKQVIRIQITQSNWTLTEGKGLKNKADFLIFIQGLRCQWTC